jgi:hypothetical protein
MTFKTKLKSRRNGGWYLSEVTMGELEIGAFMSQIFANTKSSSALFTTVIVLIKTKRAGGSMN